jgi:hypothetical protein
MSMGGIHTRDHRGCSVDCGGGSSLNGLSVTNDIRTV